MDSALCNAIFFTDNILIFLILRWKLIPFEGRKQYLTYKKIS